MVGSFLLKGSRLTQAKRFHIIEILLLGSSVAEQVTVNHLVAGSNPARAAIFIILVPASERVSCGAFYGLFP